MTSFDEPREPGGGSRAMQSLDMPGLDEALRRDLDDRINEFEARHQQDVVRGGAGWVSRIRPADYAVAIAVNAAIVIWLAIVLLGGE
jgi:hypothetical protein